jgi:hypothetical protein
MAARIAAGSRIDPDEVELANLKTRLFAHFPAASHLDLLANLDETAWESVAAAKRIVPTPDE